MSEKIIRDPVHDVIAFRWIGQSIALAFSVAQCSRISAFAAHRQLGMANLAYPGAEHSRYSHSVGVMETARKIINQLRQSFTISGLQDETGCLAARASYTTWARTVQFRLERVSGVDHDDPHRKARFRFHSIHKARLIKI